MKGKRGGGGRGGKNLRGGGMRGRGDRPWGGFGGCLGGGDDWGLEGDDGVDEGGFDDMVGWYFKVILMKDLFFVFCLCGRWGVGASWSLCLCVQGLNVRMEARSRLPRIS